MGSPFLKRRIPIKPQKPRVQSLDGKENKQE